MKSILGACGRVNSCQDSLRNDFTGMASRVSNWITAGFTLPVG